jgi:hypothetical protein
MSKTRRPKRLRLPSLKGAEARYKKLHAVYKAVYALYYATPPAERYVKHYKPYSMVSEFIQAQMALQQDIIKAIKKKGVVIKDALNTNEWDDGDSEDIDEL